MKFEIDCKATPVLVSHAPAAATDAVCSLAALTGTGEYWSIDWIGFGYDGTPAAGAELQISFGGTIKARFPVTQSGPGEFRPEKLCNVSLSPGAANFGHVPNEALEVRLTSGGGAVSGRLSIIAR